MRPSLGASCIPMPACMQAGLPAHLHQLQAQSPEPIALEQLKKVDIQLFKHQTQVFPEKEKIGHAHNVVFVMRVAARVEKLQQPNLHARLQVFTICTPILFKDGPL